MKNNYSFGTIFRGLSSDDQTNSAQQNAGLIDINPFQQYQLNCLKSLEFGESLVCGNEDYLYIVPCVRFKGKSALFF